MIKKKMNRRKFVTTTAKGVVATATLAGCTTIDKLTGTNRNPSEYVGTWKIDEANQFDYIIVGSGAGGGPLAAGLAKEGYTVLLIEAGAHTTNNLSTTPVFHAKASDDPLLNWSYFVGQYANESRYKPFERLNSKYQTEQQGIYYPRASGLGGCTRVNALISLYPDHQDWKGLSTKLGNDRRFSPEAMAKVFYNMQKENGGWINFSQASPATLVKDRFLIKMALAALSIDGIDSKSSIQKIIEQFKLNPGNTLTKIANNFQNLLKIPFDIVDTLDGVALEALRKAILEDQNFRLNPNHLGYTDSQAKENGVFNIPFNATDGVRRGVREYIIETEADHNSKLFIKANSLCTKIIFHPTEKTKAIGIEFIEGAHAYKADVMNQSAVPSSYVRKSAFAGEIILSGGAFNTPQLLMLSGIGPAESIPSSIPLVKNLPGVGKNLQDRYEVTVVSELKQPISLIKDCTFARNNDFEKDPCWLEYQKNPGSHLYGTNGVALSLIRKSSSAQPTPDLCIFGLPGYFKGYYPHYSNDTTPKKVGDPNYFTWAILKGHTKNHAGEIKLKSTDPKETPQINFKYFHDENNGLTEDLNAVFQGLKVARDLNSKIGSKYLKSEANPGSQYQSEQDLKTWIMKEAWGHHASCTSKMGLVSDPLAVVDENFKVHGIKGLRIVDASVFPDIPGLFIMLPTLMMSEKAKEIILEEKRKS